MTVTAGLFALFSLASGVLRWAWPIAIAIWLVGLATVFALAVLDPRT